MAIRHLTSALRLSLLAALCSLSFASSFPAQEEELIRVHFRSFLLHGNPPSGSLHFINHDGKKHLVEIRSNRLPHNASLYEGTNPLIIYQGETPVASVELPHESSDIILLFAASARATHADGDEPVQGYHLFPIPAAMADFPQGSYLLFNLTRRPVAALVGGQPVQLPPGNHQLVRPAQTDSDNLVMRFAEYRDDAWQRSMNVAFYYRPDQRQMLFITENNDATRSLSLRAINDRDFKPQPIDPENDS